jgi:hypothetical protein
LLCIMLIQKLLVTLSMYVCRVLSVMFSGLDMLGDENGYFASLKLSLIPLTIFNKRCWNFFLFSGSLLSS